MWRSRSPAFLVWLLTGAGGPRTVQVASIVGQFIAPLPAAVACWWRRDAPLTGDAADCCSIYDSLTNLANHRP